MDRAAIVHDNFHRRLTANDLPEGADAGDMDADTLLALYRAQCLSRQLDRTSRRLVPRRDG